MTTNERRGLFYVAFAVLFLSTTPVLIRWGGASIALRHHLRAHARGCYGRLLPDHVAEEPPPFPEDRLAQIRPLWEQP